MDIDVKRYGAVRTCDEPIINVQGNILMRYKNYFDLTLGEKSQDVRLYMRYNFNCM